MTEIWYPNSCDCIIVKDKRVHRESIQNCKLHKNLKGQGHFNAVRAHNQNINRKHGPLSLPNDFPNLAPEDMRKLAVLLNRNDVIDYIDKIDDITKSLRDEKERIRRL